MKTKVIATNLELPKALIDSLEGAELQPAALVGEDGNYKPAEKSVRSSHVAWLHESDGVVQYCLDYLHRINDSVFKFDLMHLDHHGLQYATYGVGDHYIWHVDTLDREIDRKLSFSLLLNDNYEGGEFEIARWKYSAEGIEAEHVHVPTVTGTMIVFPSNTPHRVLPVTKGIRRSLVGWMVGNPLR